MRNPTSRVCTTHFDGSIRKRLTVEIVWVVMKEDEERKKKADLSAVKKQQKEAEARREEMRSEAGLGSK